MRVAIDATSVPPQPAGAGMYAIELVRALAVANARDGYALYARGAWAPSAVGVRKNWRVETVRARTRPGRLAWEQLRLPGAIRRLGIDVLHSTHHTLPLRRVDARRVVTVHDVTFIRIPERYPPLRRFYFQAITRLSARVADAVITPSNTVRDDVARYLRVDPARIVTVYEAPAGRFRPIDAVARDAVLARYGLQPGYLLSVGSLEPGKNRPRIVKALRGLRERGVDASLVVVGQPAWKHEAEREFIASSGMADRVRYLGYVPDDDVVALYAGALAAVLPSLYEGFGLPVLGAMACGVPVLTSNVSATAEVAGDAALLVDPHSAAAIAGAVERLVGDDGLRSQLREAGLRRAAEFSWGRAADETRAVYRQVLE